MKNMILAGVWSHGKPDPQVFLKHLKSEFWKFYFEGIFFFSQLKRLIDFF